MRLKRYEVEIHHGPDCKCSDEQLEAFTDLLPTEQEVEDALHVIMRQRPEALDAPVTIKVFE